MIHKTLTVGPYPRGLHDITQKIAAVASQSPGDGLCSVFVHHTSASLVIQENADLDVRRDLEAFFARLIPDGDPLYRHVDEGPDDMPSHVRCAITASSLSIPIQEGQLALGTWQGIYLWEHRLSARPRRITVSILN